MPFQRDLTRTGKGSNAKVITVKLSSEEGSDRAYALTHRQAGALLRLSEYLQWTNRLQGLPDDLVEKDARDNWNADLQLRLMSPMEICAEIINCLETDEDVKEAFNNFLSNYLAANGYNNAGVPRTDAQNNSNLAGDTNPTCDLDVLWAQCLFMVQQTNALIEDLLDKFESITNPIEAAGTVTEVVPVVGDVIAAVPNYANLVLEFIAENYSADYTTTPIDGYEDQLAKDLFCACKTDCEITIDRFFNILVERIEERFDVTNPGFAVLNDLCNFLIGIDAGGEVVADLAFALVWGGLKLANFVVGGLINQPKIGDGILKVYLALAVDNASSDWEIIAEECIDGWIKEWNFTETDGGWTAADLDALPDAAWVDTVGWRRVTQVGEAAGSGLYIQILLPLAGKNLRRMEVDYYAEELGDTQQVIIVENATTANNGTPKTTIGIEDIVSAGEILTATFDADFTMSKDYITVYMANYFNSANKEFLFTRIRMVGDGDTPFP